MRITILSTATTLHQQGGTEVHAESLAAEAARQGHKVFILTTAHPGGLKSEVKNGYTVVYLEGTSHTMSRRTAPAWWAASAKKVPELCASEGIDVVWAENFSGLSYAKIPAAERRPILSIVQGLAVRGEIESNLKRISTTGELLYFFTRYAAQTIFYYIPRFRAMVKNSDLLIGVSRETGEALAREFPESAKKTKIIFNAVDTDRFKPDVTRRAEARKKLGFRPDEQVIVMTGVIHKQKGMHLGLSAFTGIAARFPEARLLIVGDGPQLGSLKADASKAGLTDRVRFCGLQQNKEMPFYYNAADIYLNPTLRLEGLAIVIVEAMACGLPCLVSKTGGTGSTIDDGISGYFVKPGDTEGLKLKLGVLLEDGELRRRFAAGAREKAEISFDIKTAAAAYVAASAELLAKERL
jgi:glycosyltransferase involved in cell wall biosynthesis